MNPNRNNLPSYPIVPQFPNVPIIPTVPINQGKESNIFNRLATFIYDFVQVGRIGCHLMLGLKYIKFSNFTESSFKYDFRNISNNILNSCDFYNNIFNGLNIFSMGFNFLFCNNFNQTKSTSIHLNIFETIITNFRAPTFTALFPQDLTGCGYNHVYNMYGYLHILIATYHLSNYTLFKNCIIDTIKYLTKILSAVQITLSLEEH